MKKNRIIILFFFCCQFLFAQNSANDIYDALDDFLTAPSKLSINKLSEKAILFEQTTTSKEDRLALAILQSNLGYYYHQFGELPKSTSAYEIALKLYHKEQFSEYDIVENCLIPLGNLYTKQGSFLNAENTIKQYITIAKDKRNNNQQIAGIINLSVVYNTIGNYKTAIIILTETLKQNKLTSSQKLKLQNNLASNLIALHEYHKANSILKQSLLFKGKYSHFTTYKNLSFITMRQNNFKEAVEYLELAKKELVAHSTYSARDLGKLYTEEAQLYLQSNNVSKAQKSLEKALQVLIPTSKKNTIPDKALLYAENTFITLFDLYASISTDVNDALEYYDLSFYVSCLLNKNIVSQETKIIHQAENKNRTKKCIDLLYQAYEKEPNKTYLESAFLYAEKSKSSVLQEAVEKKSLFEQFPDDEILLKEQELLQQQELITNKLIRAQLKKVPQSYINEMSFTLNEISIQLRSLNKKITKKHPAREKPISIPALQKKLSNDKAALVSYFYDKKQLYQFIVEPTGITLNKIKYTSESQKTIMNFIHFFDDATIINNNIKAYTSSAFNVYELLLLSSLQTYKNVVIIPDGLLSHLPFGSLLTHETSSTQFKTMPFVIKKQRLAYNTNTSFYLNSKDDISSEKSVLGLFPVFEKSNQELTYSIEEANSLKNKMNTKLFMNEEATKENFIRNVTNYNTIHISTHAQAGNFVIPSHIQFYDDMLFLQEIYALHTSAQLVVLSACESGVGKLQKGEGAMSLARGFQYAGADAVLFSLWKINDKSTSQIMDYFYKNYSKNSSAFLSNNQSKLDYLNNKNISNAKKSPYYWNTFVYYGATQKSESSNTPLKLYIIIGLLISILIMFIYRFKTR